MPFAGGAYFPARIGDLYFFELLLVDDVGDNSDRFIFVEGNNLFPEVFLCLGPGLDFGFSVYNRFGRLDKYLNECNRILDC